VERTTGLVGQSGFNRIQPLLLHYAGAAPGAVKTASALPRAGALSLDRPPSLVWMHLGEGVISRFSCFRGDHISIRQFR
jgi:hypothetical protein